MKSKKTNNVGLLYLKTYNLLQVFGWSYILYKFVVNDFSSTTEANLWQNVKWPVVIFQHAALLEIIHAATGLVKSNPVLTTFQVFSRIIVVSGVLLATPNNYAASSYGLPLAILAWSITEIIRYLFYYMNLNEFVPYFLTWLRYTLFIVLYPIGVTGELLCIYSAVNYANSHPEFWSYKLPNSWNFIFSYYFILITIMLSYIPLFPQLYLHMFAQRRKIIGGETSKKAN
ncbi:very-long-chain (3R)-3-hydroxyacyl-CoA dehydratase hpo-8 isoform X1 [Bombus impatiens]|uniref:Very-long-chain (3R)-3-hydroxyacyl-CoA dehydratase n=1 Tax=Bombus impatiens TaxID=132113 RepID=A0A6P3UTI4_BOMIM|nr:very-long-chain (3R)-3-hydroxyacyl-CoA dehydratase hpo-8 isoform X1 [Bombus impatiens]